MRSLKPDSECFALLDELAAIGTVEWKRKQDAAKRRQEQEKKRAEKARKEKRVEEAQRIAEQRSVEAEKVQAQLDTCSINMAIRRKST